MHVLLVEDEVFLGRALSEALGRAGHQVDWARDGDEAEARWKAGAHDLVVLDVGLPKLSGLELCRRARARGWAAPVLMLTARDTLSDKVAGLDAGADDYLVKPFELEELQARVRALARRRAGAAPEERLVVGELVYDAATGEAWRAGRALELSRKERALLAYFMRHPGRLLSREQILAAVWDGPLEPESDVVRAQIKLLRKALGDQAEPRLIQTVHGLGYRLVSDAARA